MFRTLRSQATTDRLERIRRSGLIVLSLLFSLALLVRPGDANPPSPDGAPATRGGSGARDGIARSPQEDGSRGGNDEEDEGAAEKEDAKKTTTEKDDPDRTYVLEHIKDLLSPTTFTVDEKGYATLTFNFRKKGEEHMNIFSKKMGRTSRDDFRYTFYQEEVVIGGDVGVRLSDKGVALLNCWFEDDVEAEMPFLQYVNHTNRHIGAVVFATDKGRALGSNYGTQCVEYNRGRPRRRSGATRGVAFDQTGVFKLVVKDGEFEAHRDGKKQESMEYSERYYESGRIGIMWGGSISAIVPTLKIRGKLDYKKTAEFMRKKLGDD